MKASSKANRSSILKQGSITSTKKIGLISRMPDMEGTQPMLLADLSDEMGIPSKRRQISVSAEVIQGSEQALYSFRLQIGATLVCWLADPNDPKILDMLQAWASTGHMFVGLNTSMGVIVRTRRVSGVPPSIDDITSVSAGMDAERFTRTVAEAVNSGLIKAKAQSEIASVLKIRKVRVFSVLGNDAHAASK